MKVHKSKTYAYNLDHTLFIGDICLRLPSIQKGKMITTPAIADYGGMNLYGLKIYIRKYESTERLP